MNTQVIHEVTVATQEGKMTFPQGVGKLLEIGIESYCVDFAAGRKTYYAANGETFTEPMILKLDPVAARVLMPPTWSRPFAARRPIPFAIPSSSSVPPRPASPATGPSSPASRSSTSAAKANCTSKSFPAPNSALSIQSRVTAFSSRI